MMEHKRPIRFDTKHAAQTNLHQQGHDTLSNYERLMQEADGHGGENALSWTALTELLPDPSGEPTPWLRLTVKATVPQICQRCLEPVEVPVQVDREFRFVESEALAEQQDDDCEEDLLVNSRDFDLASLIEDEVLLALPLVPLHDVCPVKVKMTAADKDFDAPAEKPNPFAMLAQIKKFD